MKPNVDITKDPSLGWRLWDRLQYVVLVTVWYLDAVLLMNV